MAPTGAYSREPAGDTLKKAGNGMSVEHMAASQTMSQNECLDAKLRHQSEAVVEEVCGVKAQQTAVNSF